MPSLFTIDHRITLSPALDARLDQLIKGLRTMSTATDNLAAALADLVTETQGIKDVGTSAVTAINGLVDALSHAADDASDAGDQAAADAIRGAVTVLQGVKGDLAAAIPANTPAESTT